MAITLSSRSLYKSRSGPQFINFKTFQNIILIGEHARVINSSFFFINPCKKHRKSKLLSKTRHLLFTSVKDSEKMLRTPRKSKAKSSHARPRVPGSIALASTTSNVVTTSELGAAFRFTGTVPATCTMLIVINFASSHSQRFQRD